MFKTANLMKPLRALLALALVVVPGLSSAAVYRTFSLDEVIEKSDAIFLATCESKRTEFRNGNIMTLYTLRPTEFITGKEKIKLSPQGTCESEQIGGSIQKESLRIGQHFTAAYTFVPGEELLLFARSYVPNKELDAVGSPRVYTPGSIEIVAHNGRYSVLTDGNTGEKYVVNSNLDASGVLANEQAQAIYLKEQSRKLSQLLSTGKGANGIATAEELTTALEASEAGTPAARHAAAKAHANAKLPAATVLHGKGGEIRNFEKLSAVRTLVNARIAAIAAKAAAK